MYIRRIICFPEPLNLFLTIFLPVSLSQCYYKFTCVLSLLCFWIFIINYSTQLFDYKLLCIYAKHLFIARFVHFAGSSEITRSFVFYKQEGNKKITKKLFCIDFNSNTVRRSMVPLSERTRRFLIYVLSLKLLYFLASVFPYNLSYFIAILIRSI